MHWTISGLPAGFNYKDIWCLESTQNSHSGKLFIPSEHVEGYCYSGIPCLMQFEVFQGTLFQARTRPHAQRTVQFPSSSKSISEPMKFKLGCLIPGTKRIFFFETRFTSTYETPWEFLAPIKKDPPICIYCLEIALVFHPIASDCVRLKLRYEA